MGGARQGQLVWPRIRTFDRPGHHREHVAVDVGRVPGKVEERARKRELAMGLDSPTGQGLVIVECHGRAVHHRELLTIAMREGWRGFVVGGG